MQATDGDGHRCPRRAIPGAGSGVGSQGGGSPLNRNMAASTPSRAMTSTASAATSTATSSTAALGARRTVQHVVGAGLAARRLADADPDAHVARVVEVGVDRLEPVVAGRAPSHLHLDPARRQVELVVDDDEPVGARDPEPFHRARRDGQPRLVHVGQRNGQHDEVIVEAGLGHDGSRPLLGPEPLAPARRQELDDLGAEVVAGPLELRSRVAETHHQQVGRRPPAGRRQQAPQGLALPARLAPGRRRLAGAGTAGLAFGRFALGTFGLGGTLLDRSTRGGCPAATIDSGSASAVTLGGRAMSRHAHRRPDDEVTDVDLEVGGDVGGAGPDGEREHLLLEHPVGPVQLERLTGEGDRDVGGDLAVGVDDLEVDVGHAAPHGMALELAGHGEEGLARRRAATARR